MGDSQTWVVVEDVCESEGEIIPKLHVRESHFSINIALLTVIFETVPLVVCIG